MSISLYYEAYCENCERFSPYAEHIETTTYGDLAKGEKTYLTNVFCEHRKACANLYKLLNDLKKE